MTTYTADDFKNARFARHPSTFALAVRNNNSDCASAPWTVVPNGRGGIQSLTDAILANFGWVPVQENPRPLTADDITDEMVDRAWRVWEPDVDILAGPDDSVNGGLRAKMRRTVVAALTPPPSRPEGAEEIRPLLRETLGSVLTGEELTAVADHLAERGVRVTGAES